MTLKKKLYRILLFFVAMAAGSAAAANAQIVGGAIRGTVRDSTGAALSGATVTVRQTDTGATRTLLTSSDGSYAAPLFNLWPVQNGPELLSNGNPSGIAEAFSHPPQHINEDFGTTRFDDNLGSKDLLFAVYTVDASAATSPSANPLSCVNESLREQVASIQEQHDISPSLLNTARFGYSRASYFFTSPSRATLNCAPANRINPEM
jgi:predicted membrane metal-binding protein